MINIIKFLSYFIVLSTFNIDDYILNYFYLFQNDFYSYIDYFY